MRERGFWFSGGDAPCLEIVPAIRTLFPQFSPGEKNVVLADNLDTIAAIATPIGEGGISVIRISGPSAFATADACFRGRVKLAEAASHTAHFGYIADATGQRLDEVVATVFKSPHSYTGEDVVEVSCHGGAYVTQAILSTFLSLGARLAEPGEFTKRAFLNGKMDLSQAEAVADLIHARSGLSLRSSLSQLQGRLSEQINAVREKLISTIGLLELELDFAEDGYEFVEKQKAISDLDEIIGRINKLLDTYKSGKIHRDGVKVVLAGAPNVGKSSLLNQLLNENRAIVTDIPGTTRDVIEENLTINGILFRVIDTAGLRKTADVVEQEGVARTKAKVEESDLVLLVLDASRPAEAPDIEPLSQVAKVIKEGMKACVVAVNKVDLNPTINGKLLQSMSFLKGLPTVRVSALTGYGIDELKQTMVSSTLGGGKQAPESSVLVTNLRHFQAIKSAKEALLLAKESLGRGESSEFVAVDLRSALDSLGEITGVVTTEEILNSIFSKFCIGK